MRHSIKYIFALVCAVAFSACSKENFEGIGQNEDIEFIMRPTTFNAVDVARPQTKAEISEVEMLAAETAIHSLYFLVFDADGTQIVFKPALTNGLPTSQNLKSAEYFKKFPLTICYIANVEESFAKSIEHISDLSTKTLDIEYSSFENTVGIPIIDKKNASDPSDDLLGFPMIGKITYPNTEVTGPQVIVPLERLFAKVTVKVKVDFNDSDLGFTENPPSFEVLTYTLHNLPKKVCLGNAISEDGTVINESSWVEDDNAFEGPYEGEINKVITDEAIDFGDMLEIEPEEVLTFYVPEYALEPEELNTALDQKIKPSLYDPDKHPIYVTLSGIVSQEEFPDSPVTYHIHFGENPYDSFSLRRNIWYTNNLYLKGTVDAFIGADLRVETEPFNLADPNRTGTDNPANCYIISKPGRYLLPTYMGNDVASGTFPNAATWEITDINGDAVNTITNVDLIQKDGKDFVAFNANVSVTDGVASLNDVMGGNKLLAIKDASGKVLWSWHLWFCEDATRPDLDVSMTRYPDNSGNWNQAYVMNRALGATDAITLNNLGLGSDILRYLASFIGIELNDFVWHDGLYYQWGRKDPLAPTSDMIDSETSAADAYVASVANPQKFYSNWNGTGAGWTSGKGINDPCPPGYKVPSKNIWRSTNPDEKGFTYDAPLIGTITVPTTTSTAYTYNLTQNVSETTASGYIFFPYGGNYNADGTKQEYMHSEGTDYTPEDYIIETTIPKVGDTYSGLINGRPQTCRRIKRVQFTYEADVNHGTFWATDNNSLKYGFSSLELQSNSDNIFGDFIENLTRTYICDYQEGTVTYNKTGTSLRPVYTCTGVNWGEWQPNQSVGTFGVGHSEIGDRLSDYLENLQSLDAYSYTIGTSVAAASGAQVRCVRE